MQSSERQIYLGKVIFVLHTACWVLTESYLPYSQLRSGCAFHGAANVTSSSPLAYRNRKRPLQLTKRTTLPPVVILRAEAVQRFGMHHKACQKPTNEAPRLQSRDCIKMALPIVHCARRTCTVHFFVTAGWRPPFAPYGRAPPLPARLCCFQKFWQRMGCSKKIPACCHREGGEAANAGTGYMFHPKNGRSM